ncbi:MFS transporter [Candidatus Woesearchaeota archaeon]|nr:MFS transporter [Candidatus Woesearchaeota archaeon]
MNSRILAWSLYDFANTAFSAMYVTIFFPIFIKIILGGTEFAIGITFGLSMLVVGTIVPLLGALIDATGRKTPYILTLTIVCCAATIATGYLSLEGALVAGFIANTAYHACLVIYNSYLPRLARTGFQGSASGIGVSLGYFGTIASIIIVALIARPYGLETIRGAQYAFIATAAFFTTFSLPLFITFWKERTRQLSVSLRAIGTEVATTITNLPKDRNMRNFLIGGFLYSNAITAAIIFLGLYARTAMRLPIDAFVFSIYPLLAIAAAIGAYIAGPLTDQYGGRRILLWSGGFWIITLLGLILRPDTLTVFMIMSCIGGAAMGAVWTARRPLLVRLAPGRKVGEYFGFEELTDKFSGVLGPIIFGYLATYYSYAAGLWTLIGFFVLGILAYAAMSAKHYKQTLPC